LHRVRYPLPVQLMQDDYIKPSHGLRMLLRHAAELGVLSAHIHAGSLKPYVKKADAFRLFGRASTERWLASGQLTPRKDGTHSAAWRIDRMEIEILSRATAIQQQFACPWN